MKKILILTLLISFIGIDIQAQSWQQVFGRQRFNAGIGIPVRDTLSPNAADSAQIVIRPQDGILYYRYKGAWIRASAQDVSNFVTISGAAQTISSAKTFSTTLSTAGSDTNNGTANFNFRNSLNEIVAYGANDGTVIIGSNGRTSMPLSIYGNTGLQMQVGNNIAWMPPTIRSANGTGLNISSIGVVSGDSAEVRITGNSANVAGGQANTILRVTGSNQNVAVGEFQNSGLTVDFNQTNATSGQINFANGLYIRPTINNTAGTSTYRGIYYNPTLSSTTGTTNYFIEATSGKVRLGDLAGTGTRVVTADSDGNISAGGTLTGYLLEADSLSGGYTTWDLTKKKVDSLGAVIATKGSGTVTSVAAGTGMNFSTITSTGTINADTTVLSTKANVTGLLTGYATTGSLSDYVTVGTTQTVTGAKTFSSSLIASTISTSGQITARSATTSAGVVPAFLGQNEFMSTGSLAGMFFENRSGGVTINSNWAGWYYSGTTVRLFNGSTDLLSITASTGATTINNKLSAGGSAISGNSHSFYNTATETSVAIKQESGGGQLALALWNNGTTGEARFVNFFTETSATSRGNIRYNRTGDQLEFTGSGNGLLFTGAATFSNTIRNFNGSTGVDILVGQTIRGTGWTTNLVLETTNSGGTVNSNQLVLNGSTGGVSLSGSLSATAGTFSDELFTSANLRVRGYAISGDFGTGYSISTGIGASGAIARGINMGWNTTADMGFIGAVHNGNAWKSLSLQPISGSLLVGTVTEAANGSKLQVNGATNISGRLFLNTTTATGVLGSAIVIRPSSTNAGQSAIVIKDYLEKDRWVFNGQDGESNYNFALYSAPNGTNDYSKVLVITQQGAAAFSNLVKAQYFHAVASTGLLVLESDWGASALSEIRTNTTINGSVGGDYMSFKNPTGKGFSFVVNSSSVANVSSVGGFTGQSYISNNSGGFISKYNSDAASRSWRMVNDLSVVGGFTISQELTKDGGSWSAALAFDANRAATFNNTVTATGFIVSSDYRYKDIISQDGDLYSYTLKADSTKQIHYGYIAQEVEKTMPFAVSTNADGYKAVNYIEVHAIKIRELEKRIEQLEKMINK